MCGPVAGLSRAGGQKFQLEETISKSLIGKHDLCKNSLRHENLVDIQKEVRFFMFVWSFEY